jgi:hypothetical protein
MSVCASTFHVWCTYVKVCPPHYLTMMSFWMAQLLRDTKAVAEVSEYSELNFAYGSTPYRSWYNVFQVCVRIISVYGGFVVYGVDVCSVWSVCNVCKYIVSMYVRVYGVYVMYGVYVSI